MLRAAVLAVLAANLLFFAWARGWLAPMWPAPSHGQREPQRQTAQVKPELINVLSARAASAAVAAAAATSLAADAADACLEAGPFSPAEADAAEASLQQAGLPRTDWERRQASSPDLIMLAVDRPSAALARQLQALPDTAPRFRPCPSTR